MSTTFARDVLSGHKKLLNLSEVLWISEIPTYHELSVKKVWEELSKDSTITCFFPDYSPTRYPEKTYLMNVINTVKPGQIVRAILKIKEARMKKDQKEEQPIIITNEYT